MRELTAENLEYYLDIHDPNIGSSIHDLWISKDDSLWSREPTFYIKLGETAGKLGQFMFSHDILKEGFGLFPDHLRMAQLYALSLIKCGFIEKARGILSDLVKRGLRDEETLGILGRVYKDMWVMSGGKNPKDPFILKSRELYLRAFKENRGYYSGINAASLSRIIGDGELAAKLAKLVLGICMKIIEERSQSNYWVLATMGEAFLLLGDEEKSLKYYSLASKKGAKNYAELASTRRQLRLLSGYFPVRENILDTLAIPTIVAFTGHMLDQPGGKRLRFPPEMARAVKDEIDRKLDRLNAGIGYSSAACGSDVLFLEGMQQRSAETNIILPFQQEDFFKTSVEHGGPDWVERAREVIGRSSRVVRATEGMYAGDDFLFTYANRIIMGEALLRGGTLESTPVLLAVWDGKKNGLEGGTFEFISRWESKKLPVEVVNLAGMRRRSGAAEAGLGGSGGHSPKSVEPPHVRYVKRAFKAMLFADIVGYSKLKEEQLPYFHKFFLCGLAKNLKRSGYKPVFKNSWGDCIYFVFDELISAAEYALELRDFVRKTNWQESHLPPSMNIRIGLHAGPVYHAREPILERVGYFGSHVTTAARIEPITSPGNVYASEQFAALLIAENRSGALECNYVGVIVLPKEFGKHPIFHIKRKMEID